MEFNETKDPDGKLTLGADGTVSVSGPTPWETTYVTRSDGTVVQVAHDPDEDAETALARADVETMVGHLSVARAAHADDAIPSVVARDAAPIRRQPIGGYAHRYVLAIDACDTELPLTPDEYDALAEQFVVTVRGTADGDDETVIVAPVDGNRLAVIEVLADADTDTTADADPDPGRGETSDDAPKLHPDDPLSPPLTPKRAVDGSTSENLPNEWLGDESALDSLPGDEFVALVRVVQRAVGSSERTAVKEHRAAFYDWVVSRIATATGLSETHVQTMSVQQMVTKLRGDIHPATATAVEGAAEITGADMDDSLTTEMAPYVAAYRYGNVSPKTTDDADDGSETETKTDETTMPDYDITDHVETEMVTTTETVTTTVPTKTDASGEVVASVEEERVVDGEQEVIAGGCAYGACADDADHLPVEAAVPVQAGVTDDGHARGVDAWCPYCVTSVFGETAVDGEADALMVDTLPPLDDETESGPPKFRASWISAKPFQTAADADGDAASVTTRGGVLDRVENAIYAVAAVGTVLWSIGVLPAAVLALSILGLVTVFLLVAVVESVRDRDVPP